MRVTVSLTFVLGLTLAVSAQPDKNPTADEKKAIDLVVKAGGKAEVDPRLPAAARVSVKLDAATDATLANLKKVTQIGALDIFDATRCTDAGYGHLKALPGLRKLSLGKSVIGGLSATALGGCKELRYLYLAGSGLSDAELTGLKGLTLLDWLDISDNPQVTDAGMTTVKGLERLQTLNLSKTAITDKGLAALKPLDGLRNLSVVGTKVTSDAAEKFADEMPNLRVVRR